MPEATEQKRTSYALSETEQALLASFSVSILRAKAELCDAQHAHERMLAEADQQRARIEALQRRLAFAEHDLDVAIGVLAKANGMSGDVGLSPDAKTIVSKQQ